MAPGMARSRFVGLSFLFAVASTALAGPPAAAADSAPCKIHNVTQDETGRSLRPMVRRAHAGDRLLVRGTCPSFGAYIERDLTIRGVGQRPTLTGRDGYFHILSVKRGAHVVLRDLIIERTREGAIINGGDLRLERSIVQDSGGEGDIHAIGNTWRLTVVDSIIRRNLAAAGRDGGDGGGIWSIGGRSRLVLRRSLVVGNVAEGGHGGGIYSVGRAVVRLVDTIVRGNQAHDGGGIYAGSAGTLAMVDSVVRRNSADAQGGGVFTGAETTLTRSSVTANTAGTEGGGVFNDEGAGGTVTLDEASTVNGNTPDDCVGTQAC